MKQKIGRQEESEYGSEVKIWLSFLQLKDEFMVKDFVDLKDHGLFVKFRCYPVTVIANEDIKVWLGKRKCKPLKGGAQEVFRFPKNGKFAVTRNE